VLRTCVGCRRQRPKAELIRLVCDPGGPAKIDTGLRLPGRGSYLCRERAPECLRLARRRKALARSLRVGDHVIDYEALAARLGGRHAEEPQQ